MRTRTGASGALAGLLALSMFAAACGGDDADDASGSSETTTAEGGSSETTAAAVERGFQGDCASEEVFCIGLVTDVGKVDDKSFNQSAWEGAQEAAGSLGGFADYIETVDSKDYATNIQSFIDKDADVVITVGFALGEATAIAAAANPETHFIGVDAFQAEVLPNVTGLVFNEDKAGFMAGALAGLLTETNVVGAVLGTDLVPPVVAFGKGWEAGAKHTNPDVEVITTYHPGGLDVAFADPTWGAQTAKQTLDNNADVIFGAGGKTGNGALIEIAKQEGAYCVGVDTDQWETVPEAHPCLVTSAMKLIDDGVVELAGQVKDGSIEGGNYFGKVGLAPFHDFDSKIPADVKTEIEQIIADVDSGKLPTGVN
ncbi:MAG: BMP family ABC transporter substrate-binding protein [Acidimicrobiia bacterium]